MKLGACSVHRGSETCFGAIVQAFFVQLALLVELSGDRRHLEVGQVLQVPDSKDFVRMGLFPVPASSARFSACFVL